MKQIKFLPAVLLLGASNTLAQTAADKPRYEVRRATSAITIDGKVEAAEWSAASAPVELIFPWDSQTGAKQKTRVRLLWDSQQLYVPQHFGELVFVE